MFTKPSFCFNEISLILKIQEILQTRTCAQIRSHAQKFIIKLCKKYQIKIKSKKFRGRDSKHLNFVYKKKVVNPRPVEAEDQKFLDLFNYYKREQKIFIIEKIHNNHDSTNCPFKLRKLKRHDLSNKNNVIWKINKTSNENEDSNLLYIPNQTIIQSDNSYNSFNDFNVYELNFQNDYAKAFGSRESNIRKNSNSVKFSSCIGTPNKMNSTNHSFNSKNNQNLSFNSKKSNFNDIIEFSNDFSQEKINEDHSMNAYFYPNSNLSNDKILSFNTKKIEDKSKNFKKSFFGSLEKEKAEEIKIIGKDINEAINIKKENESNIKQNNMNINTSKEVIDFLNELQYIKNYNLKTISYLKNGSVNLQENPITNGSPYENFMYKSLENIHIFNTNNPRDLSQLEGKKNIEKTNLYNHNINNNQRQFHQINQTSGYEFFN